MSLISLVRQICRVAPGTPKNIVVAPFYDRLPGLPPINSFVPLDAPKGLFISSMCCKSALF